jgi:hypothetical protein
MNLENMMPKTLALVCLPLLILLSVETTASAGQDGPLVLYEGKLTKADHTNAG